MRRLGYFDAQRANLRMVKVTLVEEKLVHLFKNVSKLKVSDKFKNVFLVSDKIPRQLDHYNKLKHELDRRKNNGETNLVIKYIDGIPKITTHNLNN